MKRFYTAIVRRRRLVLAVFALAAVLSVFAVRQVKVDYDINDYLPPESPSTTAIEVMNGAFTGGIPNMRVMVRDVMVPQALEYKEKLAVIDGVSAVAWLDDSLDVTVPLQMQDTATVESYYKDGCALFTVTVEDEKRLEAVAAVRDLIGEGNALEGAAVSTAVATNSTVTEVAKIAAIAVVYVLFILILTTDSWAEPLLVLTGLGAAILLNNGTNLIFGTISFVTNAAGSILQLAVSLDYSVFLIHRFAECRAENPDASPEECMVDALCRSTGSILSSGLTTVIGFLALVLMQFQIGPDLGLALAKGVVLSLVTVFTFMPALTLACYKWMDKTHHRPLLPSFDKFGRFVARIMLPMALVLVILMVPSYLASNSNQYYYGAAHMFGENTRLGADTAAIEETFGRSDTYVVLVPEGDTATQQKLSDALHTIPEAGFSPTKIGKKKQFIASAANKVRRDYGSKKYGKHEGYAPQFSTHNGSLPLYVVYLLGIGCTKRAARREGKGVQGGARPGAWGEGPRMRVQKLLREGCDPRHSQEAGRAYSEKLSGRGGYLYAFHR